MQPLIGFLTPVKAALGEWLTDFHATRFRADTPANAEWAARASQKAMAWAPGRMVDQIEQMLSTWERNANSTANVGQSAYLPALFVATAPDWTEIPGEAGRPMLDDLPFAFPDDPLHRIFHVRTMGADIRTQVVVVANDPLTAMSMIGQLALHLSRVDTLHATYTFGAFTSTWPAKIIMQDRVAVPHQQGEQMTILAMDLTLRATMPIFTGPAPTEPNDGNTPPGYPVVTSVTNAHNMKLGPPTGVTAAEWAHYASLMRWAENPAPVVLGAVGEGVA